MTEKTVYPLYLLQNRYTVFPSGLPGAAFSGDCRQFAGSEILPMNMMEEVCPPLAHGDALNFIKNKGDHYEAVIYGNYGAPSDYSYFVGLWSGADGIFKCDSGRIF